MMRHLLLASGALAALVATAAQAQDQAAPGDIAAAPVSQTASNDDDIVVTAQRRSESAQDVPISLTALSSATLEKASINNVQDLQRVVPSFSAYRAPQAANTRLSIRGIGSSGNAAIEPSVGAFVDGIYIARPGPLLAGLNDIAGVEVLRGPQGTLFGRNASVGALSFRTTEPKQEFEGSFSLEHGSYDRWRANGILNVPLNEKVAVRGSLLFDEFAGYGFNSFVGNQRFGRNRTLSGRAGIATDLSEGLRWVLRGDYQSQRGDGQTPIPIDVATLTSTAATNFRTRLNGLQPRLDATDYVVRQFPGGRLRDDQWGLSSDLSLELGDYTLRLISGYRDWRNRQTEGDITLTAADLFGRNASFDSRTHSQELQIISPSNSPLTFVAGLYYFREDYTIGTRINLGTGYCNILIRNTLPARLTACLAGPQSDAAVNSFNQITSSYAAYGQATYKITPMWDVTVGLRYSHDSKDATLRSVAANSAASIISVADSADLTFDGGRLTYRLNTTYRPIERVMFFATVSTGYKSGGFDSGTGVALGNRRVFRPELTTNYEVGWKTEFLDRKITFNNTFFRMDIDQFQLRSYDGVAFSVRNAGSIRQSGAEFEVTGRPTRNLTLGVSATRLYSEFTDFRNAPNLPGFGGTQDLTGKRVSFSPEWQGIASADYTAPLGNGMSLAFNGRVAFVSDIDTGSAGDANPQGIQDGYALVGGRISLYGPEDRWEIAVSGENLTDKNYCTLRYAQTFGGPLGLNNPTTGGTVQRCVLGEPRVLRVLGKVRF